MQLIPHTMHDRNDPISNAPDELVRLRTMGFSSGMGQDMLAT